MSTLAWHFETEAASHGHQRIAGLDEAGRGCLAGPVVAAALIFLDRDALPPGLDDSKKLPRAARQRLYQTLTTDPRVVWATASADVPEIEHLNILHAAMLAMQRAAEAILPAPDFLLVDGNRMPQGHFSGRTVIGGDALSPSIAAASILAKETRDRMMESLDHEHPAYGFARHKGYGTAAHLRALRTHGPCPQHRRSFAPVAQMALPFTH
jgi:ribonuclease HII